MILTILYNSDLQRIILCTATLQFYVGVFFAFKNGRKLQVILICNCPGQYDMEL